MSATKTITVDVPDYCHIKEVAARLIKVKAENPLAIVECYFNGVRLDAEVSSSAYTVLAVYLVKTQPQLAMAFINLLEKVNESLTNQYKGS